MSLGKISEFQNIQNYMQFYSQIISKPNAIKVHDRIDNTTRMNNKESDYCVFQAKTIVKSADR